MALIDEALIKVESGAGGNGCVAFRREKYVPRGGPSGGDGGNGGSVYLEATLDKSSLLDFKYRPCFKAKRGQHGKGSDMNGRSGEDLILQVPCGTLVYDKEGGLIADLKSPGSRLLVARGGKGGLGNMNFATPTNRAPTTATPGDPGEASEFRLELRLIADVGLLGMPNAGKSTLISVITHAHPKIADYPFTTLAPNLGVVYHKNQSFVVSDLPGLIEGASEGAGLGIKFLKHVSRSRILLHLVELSTSVRQISRNIKVIRNEVQKFDPALADREEVLVFTKADLLHTQSLKRKQKALQRAGFNGFYISSHSGLGLDKLLDYLSVRAQRWKKEEYATLSDKSSMQSNLSDGLPAM